MIDTPAGPIPTLADLSIMAGRPTFRPDNGKRSRRERVEEVFQFWLSEIGPNCLGCGTLMYSYSGETLRRDALEQITLDHIVARALGGGHETTNQWCICRGCNWKKAAIEAQQAERRRAAA